ncbi:M14 family metallopeptidase [Pseudoalteromonas sp. SG45-5]|uniref:M14 family metallopeptidase n=1 Tax=unclassified Pseudoalteromonas TaxID=194690 RepID=UPI0015FA6262|nr:MULTISPECIES: M14 family metallopeptidase [unclassified Pseudoalteromonas]MBB1387681.1 M14 family metallopeptidase [Pseudoalteromonas sp. SG45-5]MBB1395925.1 M14 family metallopeptidase [Pseudoalteromonas sp. SG44-4]MBB1449097.1 M14 family metallopeptidase [Pseudoalteromonas sp. SG41-6]
MFASLLFLSASVAYDAHLPPLIKWQGQSVELLQKQGPLTTDFELSGGEISPDYAGTMAFVDRLVAANPTQFKSQTIGYSNSKRAIKMLVASEQGFFEAGKMANSTKPTIFIQAGIHAGEIDGKDAMFMLLRDIAIGKRRDILKKVNILFIPILNVDGHERSSVFNRINQRGPAKMGFRTNANNLNLNRDFAKLDTPEVRSVLKVINDYNPNLYIDVHVTDGADYQYDVTYGYNPVFSSESPAVSDTLNQFFKPVIDNTLAEQGHTPGPLVFVMDKRDFKKGLAGWVATPRYSNGWGDLKSLPTILVENHSLKPYKQRVLGTYVFLDGIINALSAHSHELANAVKKEQEFVPKQLIVKRGYAKQADTIAQFKGIEYSSSMNALSGQNEVKYLGKAHTYIDLPIYWQKDVEHTVEVPKAFFIPPVYSDIIEKLKLHGVSVNKLEGANTQPLKVARVTEHSFDKAPFEGRFRVSASFDYLPVINIDLDGWYQVTTQQKAGELAVHLLHPEAPDSFFAWGEFNTIFQRTEYMENYALIPYARKMLKDKPTLALAFDKKINDDKAFSLDPDARLNWLYEHSPFYDQAYLKYPILMSFEEKVVIPDQKDKEI